MKHPHPINIKEKITATFFIKRGCPETNNRSGQPLIKLIFNTHKTKS